jgi:3D (Asp-Asp-Asp) domain-containing protein
MATAAVCGCAGIRPPTGVKPLVQTMMITGYCSCGTCCGWERNWLLKPVYSGGPNKGQTKRVGWTASGTKARYGTIAADTSLYPFGTIMYIEGYGYGRVEDRGGAIRGNRIDLYFPSHHKARNWGRKKLGVYVWFVPDKR